MFNFSKVVVVFLMIFVSINTFAKDDVSNKEGTKLHISVEGRTTIKQDAVICTLSYKSEDQDKVELQNRINSVVEHAIKISEEFSNVELSTKEYILKKEQYKKENKVSKSRLWNGVQNIELKSMFHEELVGLTAKLQELGFVIEQLNYYLSEDKKREISNDVLGKAIDELLKKSQFIVTKLGKSNFKIVEINVHRMDNFFRNQFVGSSRGNSFIEKNHKEITKPTVRPGQEEVILEISAIVELVE